MTLHADATATLSGWLAPDDDQEFLREQFLALLAAHDDAPLRACRPDHLTASALVVRRQPGGVAEALLVLHSKAGKWLQLGGHCEPGDVTLAATALREAREESGITDLVVDPVPLRLSRHAVPFCGPPPGGHHLDVQFLVRAPASAALSIAADEDPAQWFALDPTVVPEPTDQDVRALIAAATTRLRETP